MSQINLIGHEKILFNFITLYKENKLPKKILLSGAKGIGKSLLIKKFLLNIFNDEKSKLLIENNNHTNILNIKKKDGKNNIEIDQVREIIKFSNQSAFNNKSRFILIEDAEYFNINSANALLKSLEEPNPKVFFILIFNAYMNLIDTVKSRCVEYKMYLNIDDTKLILNKHFNENIFDKINVNLKNYYSTPKFLISLTNYLKENNLEISDTHVDDLIKNIIHSKHYEKHIFIKEYLNYIIELFFYNHINITKKITYKVKKYYYSKLINIRKFNLDYESFFLEFEDKLLSE